MSPRPSSAPPLLTEAEAATYLGKTREALRAMRKRGTGPTATMVGRQPRYAWAHIQQYLRERAVGSERV